jgi:hypothetical protein
VGASPDSVFAGPPQAQIALHFRVLDGSGDPLAGASVQYTVEGEAAALVAGSESTRSDGTVDVIWMLGIHATDLQKLRLSVTHRHFTTATQVTGVVVPQDVVTLSLPDTIETRLHQPLALPVVATDPFGNRFTPSGAHFQSTDTTVVVVDSTGRVSGRGRGYGDVIVTLPGLADTTTVHIFQVVGAIETADTVTLHSLGQLTGLDFAITSDSGYALRDTLPLVSLADSTIARVEPGTISDQSVHLRSVANGTTQVTISVGSVSRTVTVRVVQQAATVALSPDQPVTFSALGDTAMVTATAWDSLGVPIVAPRFLFSTSNPLVAQVDVNGRVVSTGDGTTHLVAREVSGGEDTLSVQVSQVADSLAVTRDDTLAIMSAGLWSPPPITCGAWDRNGFPLARTPTVASRSGTLMGLDCATMIARHSGPDTLTFTSGAHSITLPVVLAVRPAPDSRIGAFIGIDSFPLNHFVWAPSVRVNTANQTELFVAGYPLVHDSNGVGAGALHRLVSHDGLNFRYDGVILGADTVACTLSCSGVENVVVMPRADAPGWRMLYAAGSSGTYGWQVFSAVSDDERTWTAEPGIRISNGGVEPPAPPVSPPWPAGEGMIVEQLSSGEWQLIMGGYERVLPAGNQFQLVEYRSMDQLTWNYVGPVLTTRDLPPEAQRSVYSPGLVEFYPGLWRLFFSGDNTNVAGGRSRIFSAVSTDRQHWQFEGEVLGASGTNLFYSALAGNHLYFIRQDAGSERRLAHVELTMP